MASLFLVAGAREEEIGAVPGLVGPFRLVFEGRSVRKKAHEKGHRDRPDEEDGEELRP